MIKSTFLKSIKIAFVLLSTILLSPPAWASCVASSLSNAILATTVGDVCTNTSGITTTNSGFAGMGMSDSTSSASVDSVSLINSESGNITISGNAPGIHAEGAYATVINNGIITTNAGDTGGASSRYESYGNGINALGDNANVINTNLITVNGDAMIAIQFGSSINGALNNQGHIIATGIGTVGVASQGSMTNFINSGEISSLGPLGSGIAVYDVDALFNTVSGAISGDFLGINAFNTIRNFSNAGLISSNGFAAIFNSGTILSLENSGLIDGHEFGILNLGSTGIISNTGSIVGGYVGINNVNSNGINTLNNLQGAGNTHGALTLDGHLPINYNVIILSPTHFGQLSVINTGGTTNFEVYSASTLARGTYSAVLAGIDLSNLIKTSGSFLGFNWRLINSSSSIWDLVVTGTSTFDTLASMVPNANALRGVFNLQSAIINTGLSYDCTTFDKHGICLSTGGRVTDTQNSSANAHGALLIASYRANEQWRLGGYLDQVPSSTNARGVTLNNNNPVGGVFAVWSQYADSSGYQLRLAAGYNEKHVTISRSVLDTAQAGAGDASLRSQAYSATLSRGFQISNSRWMATPYLGARHIKIKRAGYTEESSAEVTMPLTYSTLSQETTTALAGIRLNGQLGDKLKVMASVGLENNIAHKTGDYAATGVDDLTPIAFNQSIRRTRPVVSTGASYAIDQRQAVGLNLHLRQDAINSSRSVTGMLTYQLGF